MFSDYWRLAMHFMFCFCLVTIFSCDSLVLLALLLIPSFSMGVHGHSHNATSYADYSTAMGICLLEVHGALCWGHTFLQANDTTWSRSTSSDEDTHVRYIAMHQTMVKRVTKAARGRDQHLKHPSALVRASKMADNWSSSFDANSVTLRRGCLTKNTISFNHSQSWVNS